MCHTRTREAATDRERTGEPDDSPAREAGQDAPASTPGGEGTPTPRVARAVRRAVRRAVAAVRA